MVARETRARRGRSRCSRACRNSRAGPGVPPRRARAGDCAPTRRRRHSAPPITSAVRHQPAADSGAEDDAEQAAGAGPGAVHRLRQGEAVGVVLQPDRAGRARCARSRSRAAPMIQVELAFLTRPVAGERAPGMPTPTEPRPPASRSRSRTRAAMASERRPVVALRTGQAPAGQGFARIVEHDAFDLGAAQIDADSHCEILPFQCTDPAKARGFPNKC